MRVLSPGLFVRVRIPLGEPHPALLVTDRAVGTDQGLKYLYVVDAENKVQYRRVTLGPLQDDGLRVIAEGLQPDDWVAISGLQQIRPRMEVKPVEMSMPIPVDEAAQSQAAAAGTTEPAKASAPDAKPAPAAKPAADSAPPPAAKEPASATPGATP